MRTRQDIEGARGRGGAVEQGKRRERERKGEATARRLLVTPCWLLPRVAQVSFVRVSVARMRRAAVCWPSPTPSWRRRSHWRSRSRSSSTSASSSATGCRRTTRGCCWRSRTESRPSSPARPTSPWPAGHRRRPPGRDRRYRPVRPWPPAWLDAPPAVRAAWHAARCTSPTARSTSGRRVE